MHNDDLINTVTDVYILLVFVTVSPFYTSHVSELLKTLTERIETTTFDYDNIRNAYKTARQSDATPSQQSNQNELYNRLCAFKYTQLTYPDGRQQGIPKIKSATPRQSSEFQGSPQIIQSRIHIRIPTNPATNDNIIILHKFSQQVTRHTSTNRHTGTYKYTYIKLIHGRERGCN